MGGETPGAGRGLRGVDRRIHSSVGGGALRQSLPTIPPREEAASVERDEAEVEMEYASASEEAGRMAPGERHKLFRRVSFVFYFPFFAADWREGDEGALL